MANELKTSESQDLTTDNTKVQEQIDDLRREARKIREDFLLIFGLLAAIIAFLSAQVQAYQHLKHFSALMGFDAFLIAALLTFVVGLKTIARETGRLRDYSAAIILIIVFLIISAACFYWSTHGYIFFIR